MKPILGSIPITLALMGVVASGAVKSAQAEFPEKPITIVAYMKPGGAG